VGKEYPTLFWSLDIHKCVIQGSQDGTFVEKVYHTIQIKLEDELPEWWSTAQLGSGSHWHSWKAKNDNCTRRSSHKQREPVTQTAQRAKDTENIGESGSAVSADSSSAGIEGSIGGGDSISSESNSGGVRSEARAETIEGSFPSSKS